MEFSRSRGLLQSARVHICGLLTEVRATVTAMQRLTDRYFPGRSPYSSHMQMRSTT